MKVIGIKANNIVLLPVGITVIDAETPRISRFTGGAIAALILISLSLVFYWLYKRKRQGRFFGLFSIILGIACIGLIEVFVEPFFPIYHRSLVNSIVLIAVAIIVPIIINIVHRRKHGELNW